MPKDAGYGLDINPGAKHFDCERMPEMVKRMPRHPSVSHDTP